MWSCFTMVCPTTPETDVPPVCLLLLNFKTPSGLYLPRVKSINATASAHKLVVSNLHTTMPMFEYRVVFRHHLIAIYTSKAKWKIRSPPCQNLSIDALPLYPDAIRLQLLFHHDRSATSLFRFRCLPATVHSQKLNETSF